MLTSREEFLLSAAKGEPRKFVDGDFECYLKPWDKESAKKWQDWVQANHEDVSEWNERIIALTVCESIEPNAKLVFDFDSTEDLEAIANIKESIKRKLALECEKEFYGEQEILVAKKN